MDRGHAETIRPETAQIPCRLHLLGNGMPAARGASPVASPDLPRQVAQRELETEQERQNYTYRQTVLIEELDGHGIRAVEYVKSATSCSLLKWSAQKRSSAVPSGL